MKKLMHEGIVGNRRIRAYDFEEMPGREPRYVEGQIINRGMINGEFMAYTILVDVDTMSRRIGEKVYVPYEMDFDFDGRVVLLNGLMVE